MLHRQPIAPQRPAARKPLRTLRRLVPYWREHWLLMGALTLCSLVSVGVTLLTPIVIGRAIDNCITLVPEVRVDYALLAEHLGVLAVLYVVALSARWAQDYGMVWVAQSVVCRLRREMMARLLQMDIRYYDENSRGDLLSRFSNDAEMIKDGLGSAMIQIVTTLVTMVSMIAVMLTLSAEMTLLVSVSLPLVVVLTRVVVGRSHKFFSAQQRAMGGVNSVIDESIKGLRVIRAFGKEEQWRARFGKENDALAETGMRAQINSGLMMPLLRVLDSMMYILVAVGGGLMAVKGMITIGIIQSFLLYTRQFLRPVNEIATQMNAVQAAIAGAERVLDLMDQEPTVRDRQQRGKTAEVAEAIKGDVEFRGVSFGYTAGQEILHEVSLRARRGEVVAIVGSTGAGKTTMMNLLARFYDVEKGAILIDGRDIRDYPLARLRQSMAIVLQDNTLFSGTIHSNIAYGKPLNNSRDAVRHSATVAHADDFVAALCSGYDTEISNATETISKGERQLLTIARAVHRDAPILILDEATSNVDTNTELLLQEAIRNLSQGRTCFIIAHRLSTVRSADKIVVMEQGRIVEQGTHDQLMNNKGRYWQMNS